jgi:hypothetical protein
MLKTTFLALGLMTNLVTPSQAFEGNKDRRFDEMYQKFAEVHGRRSTSETGAICSLNLERATVDAFANFEHNPQSLFEGGAPPTEVLVEATKMINISSRSVGLLLDGASTANRAQRIAVGVALAAGTQSCHPLFDDKSAVMSHIISSSLPEVLMGYASYQAGVPSGVIIGNNKPTVSAATN